MKIFYLTAVCMISVARTNYIKRCRNQSDCNVNECCRSKFQFRGRRALTSYASGVCEPRPQSGDSCISSAGANHLGTHLRCPCATGLTCKPTGHTEIPIGKSGICKPKIRKCNSESDCNANECCVSDVRLRGKRDTRTYSGTCQPLGTEGSRCIAEPWVQPPVGTHFRCPCTAGLSCENTGVAEIPIGEVGKCAPVRRCNSASDCKANECCVSDVRPIGKRDTSGTCQPLGEQGSSCLVRNKLPLPTSGGVFESCPCGSGFKCVGKGLLDIPLGEIGKCQNVRPVGPTY